MSKKNKNINNQDSTIEQTNTENIKEEVSDLESQEETPIDKIEETLDENYINDSKDKEIIDLNNKVNLLQEALLRNQAELQNYKRRKEEETTKILKYKNEDLIKEFLSIIDNFERAIKMDDNDLSDEVSKFLAGFKLIYTNMLNILNQFDVKEISAEGVEFDPEFHHAVLTDHDESKPAGVVLEVLQKGYLYKDRVIRPAMVKVNE